MQASWTVAASAPPAATFECVHTWYTDFRQDLARVDVPTLVIHGDRDRIVPLGASGALTTRAIKGSRYVTVEGGPHGILWTHADVVNRELVSFLE